MTTKIFAYGSISEGMVHFQKLEPFLQSQKAGWVRGSAYRLKVGYPVILQDGDDLIPGHILELRANEILMALLDEFFGCNPMLPEKSLYHRNEADVVTDGGASEERAYVYFLNPKKLPGSATLIAGGNWKQEMREKDLLTEKLTEKQRTYIQKLGGASGRDIIPINDLALYRELMGLELIVDKGRRLALSKLGQEVYRYLG